MPASGLVPPLRTFVAVRAIAHVAAKPPNSGATMFATPCPISSCAEHCAGERRADRSDVRKVQRCGPGKRLSIGTRGVKITTNKAAKSCALRFHDHVRDAFVQLALGELGPPVVEEDLDGLPHRDPAEDEQPLRQHRIQWSAG